jgi:hypothetical protein
LLIIRVTRPPEASKLQSGRTALVIYEREINRSIINSKGFIIKGLVLDRMIAVFARRERKVRTPQSSVPDNVRDSGFKPVRRKAQQRIYRLGCKAEVRVKRCGKSAPPAQ